MSTKEKVNRIWRQVIFFQSQIICLLVRVYFKVKPQPGQLRLILFAMRS